MELILDAQSLVVLDSIFESTDFDNDVQISPLDLKLAAGYQSEYQANHLFQSIKSILNISDSQSLLTREEFRKGILYFPQFIQKFKLDLWSFIGTKTPNEEISEDRMSLRSDDSFNMHGLNISSSKPNTSSSNLNASLKRNLTLMDQALRLNLENPALSEDSIRSSNVVTNKDETAESLSDTLLLQAAMLDKKLKESRMTESSKRYKAILLSLKGTNSSQAISEYSFTKSELDKPENYVDETAIYSEISTGRLSTDKLTHLKNSIQAKQLECRQMNSIRILYEIGDVSFLVDEFKKYRLSAVDMLEMSMSPQIKAKSARYSNRYDESYDSIKNNKSDDISFKVKLLADKEQEMELRFFDIKDDYDKQIKKLRNQNKELYKLLKQERLRNNDLRISTNAGRLSVSPLDGKGSLYEEVVQIRSNLKQEISFQDGNFVDKDTQVDITTIPHKVIPISNGNFDENKIKGEKNRFCGFSFW